MANGIEDTKADVKLDTAAHKHLVLLLGKRHEPGQRPALDWAVSADGTIYLYRHYMKANTTRSTSMQAVGLRALAALSPPSCLFRHCCIKSSVFWPPARIPYILGAHSLVLKNIWSKETY